MRLPRLFGCLALASGFVWLALPATPSYAQPPGGVKEPYRKDAPRPGSDISNAITEMRDGKLEVGINPKGPDGAKHQEYLKKTAEFLIFPVTHREFYTPTIERKTAEGKKIDIGQPDKDKTLDGVLSELERYVLIPDARSKSPANQFEYIQEFGRALDAAINAILNDPSNTPPPVKLNAVRALTVACKSGAKAHAKTVLHLLTDEKVPLYLKYHALKAAENLLAAGDMQELQGPNPYKHSIPDADLAGIVNATEAIIVRMNKELDPPPAKPAVPAAPATPAAATSPVKAGELPAKPAEPPGKNAGTIEAAMPVVAPAAVPLDPDVAAFIRKQAVRTLSKVRVVSVPGPNRTLAARPAVMLARIAVGDPAFPYVSPFELADAVTGLATVTIDGTTNVDVLLDAIAAGVSGIGGAKMLSVTNGAPGTADYKKFVPWKKTAAQVAAALSVLRNSPDKNPVALSHRNAIGSLITTCTTYVLSPIEAEKDMGTNAAVNQTMVDDFRKQISRKSDLLIQNDAASKVPLPNQRAAGR